MKSSPTSTTTSSTAGIPGWQSILYPGLQQWQSQFGGGQGTPYGGQLTAGQNPMQTGAANISGDMLAQFLGNMGQNPGADTFRLSQGALNSYLQPGFTDPQNDPYFQQQMGNVLAQTRQRYGNAGLAYGTPLANAEMSGAADVLGNIMGQRQNLQAGLAQYGLGEASNLLQQQNQFGTQAQGTAQAGLTNAYQDWLRQQQQGQGGLANLINWGMGMAPQSTTGTQNAGSTSVLGSLLGMLGGGGSNAFKGAG